MSAQKFVVNYNSKKGLDILQCYEILSKPNPLICLHMLPHTSQCKMHHIICASRIFVQAFVNILAFQESSHTSRIYTILLLLFSMIYCNAIGMVSHKDDNIVAKFKFTQENNIDLKEF